MSKINIEFDGKIYSIDENTLVSLSSPLEQALIKQLAGTGAVIRFNGNDYNVDANKLASTRNVLTDHLSTIAGTDSKVVVGGVEFGLNTTKLQDATDKMNGTLNGIANPPEDPDIPDEPVLPASEGLSFRLNDDGASYSVDGSGDCSDVDIVIPSEYNGLPVTSIYEGAFEELDGIYSIVIPDTVISIGSKAFYNCYELESITIPDSVTIIGDSAFTWCDCLTTIDIPNGVTNLDGSMFRGCRSLTSVIIPNSVTSMSGRAFDGCSSLTSIPIPDSVTIIDNHMFRGCNSLTSIAIPNSVTSIGEGAFEGCSGLTSVTIPNSVTSIGIWAFNGCSQLESVIIGEGIIDIHKTAFESCTDLTDIHINKTTDSVSGAPWGAPSSTVVHWRSEEPTDPEVNYSQGLEFVLNDDGASYTIAGLGTCTDTDITIPSSYENYPVTKIGDGAFGQLWVHTYTIRLPNTITHIGDSAFCSSDIHIIFAGTVAEWNAIEKGFEWNFNASVRAECTDGWGDCSEEEPEEPDEPTPEPEPEPDTPEAEASVGLAYALNDDGTSYTVTGRGTCTDNALVIPSTYEGLPVTVIAERAFYSQFLDSVTIPDSVAVIEDDAFAFCGPLERVNIGSGITSIADEAFCCCEGGAFHIARYKDEVSGAPWGSMQSIVHWLDATEDFREDEEDEEGEWPEIDDSLFEAASTITEGTTPVTVDGEGQYCCFKFIPTASGEYTICDLDSGSDTYGYLYDSNYNLITSNDDMDGGDSYAFMLTPTLTANQTYYIVARFYDYWETGSFTLLVRNDSGSQEPEEPEPEDPDIPEEPDEPTPEPEPEPTSLAYSLNSDGQSYSVAGLGSCSDSDIVIASEYEGLPVTGISYRAFINCTGITSVTIPDSVTNIGSQAFKDCTALTAVTTPKSVTKIGVSAFRGCSSLASATIKNGAIAGEAFLGCWRLLNVVLEDGVTKIGEMAFENCGFYNITIPDTVTEIGAYAFANCGNLSYIDMSDNLTHLGEYPFYKTAYYNNESNWENGVLYIGNTIIEADTNILPETYQIKDGTRVIADFAFKYSAVTSIVIPESTMYIGQEVFAYCESLAEITFKGTTAQWDSIDKREAWNYNVPAEYIICSDGQVENEYSGSPEGD